MIFLSILLLLSSALVVPDRQNASCAGVCLWGRGLLICIPPGISELDLPFSTLTYLMQPSRVPQLQKELYFASPPPSLLWRISLCHPPFVFSSLLSPWPQFLREHLRAALFLTCSQGQQDEEDPSYSYQLSRWYLKGAIL